MLHDNDSLSNDNGFVNPQEWEREIDEIVKVEIEKHPNWAMPPEAQADYEELPPELSNLIATPQLSNCPIFEQLYTYTKQASPRSIDLFCIGAVINTLSTVAAGRVRIGLTHKGLLTDFYILNCAPSSIYAKSEAASVQDNVLHRAGLSFLRLPSQISPSRIFTKMTPANLDTIDDPDQVKEQQLINKFAGQRGMFFDEMGNYLEAILEDRGSNGDWSRILRELKSYPVKIEHSTNAHGDRIIHNPYLTILGNATPSDFWAINSSKLQRFKGDGFFARFWFATPSTTEKPRYAITFDHPSPSNNLIASLRAWHDRLPVSDNQRHFKRVDMSFDEDAKYLHSSLDEWLFYVGNEDDIVPDWKPNYIRHASNVAGLAGLLASVNGSNEIGEAEYLLAMQIGELYRQSLHRFFETIDNPVIKNQSKLEEDAVLGLLHKWAGDGKLPVYRSKLEQKLKKQSLFKNTSKRKFNSMLEEMHFANLIDLDGNKVGLLGGEA